ncbi:hypothetical protein Droror1_Dr00014499 [Drosera rotundifolia]
MEAEIEAGSGDALDAYMTDGLLLRGGAIECGVNILICCVHLEDMEKAEVCFSLQQQVSTEVSLRGVIVSCTKSSARALPSIAVEIDFACIVIAMQLSKLFRSNPPSKNLICYISSEQAVNP